MALENNIVFLIMKKRKGSVLLQTLTVCVILAYIAVSLVGWVMGRYTQSAKSFSASAANLEANAEIGTYLSTIDPNYNGNISCINGSNNGSPNGFSYTFQCRSVGNSNIYTLKLSEGGKVKPNIFVR